MRGPANSTRASRFTKQRQNGRHEEMSAFVIQPTVKAATLAHFHNSGADYPTPRAKQALAIFHLSIEQATNDKLVTVIEDVNMVEFRYPMDALTLSRYRASSPARGGEFYTLMQHWDLGCCHAFLKPYILQQWVRATPEWNYNPGAEQAACDFFAADVSQRAIRRILQVIRREKATRQALRATLKAAPVAAKPEAPPANRGGGGASGGTDRIALARRQLCLR